MALERLVTVKDLTETVGVSRQTIETMIKDGRLPKPMQIGRNLRWHESEIMDWLENQKEARPKKF